MSVTQNLKSTLLVFAVSFALLFITGFLVANAQESDATTTVEQDASAGDLDANIKKSEKLIRELSEKLEGTPDSNPDKAEAKKLFNEAKNTLNEVHPALASGRKDEASTKATASVRVALEAIGKLDSAEAGQLVAQDENVTHQDLGVGDPRILPGNPLYLFKGAYRTAQTFTTFNPVKKAELKMRFANEKIIEANKLAERGASDDRLKSAIGSYEKEVGRVKNEIGKLKGLDETRVEELVKRTADNQIKHHNLLGKFMKNHEGIAPEIETKKAEAMKHFSESMISVVEPEVMKEKFLEVMEEQKGSAFRRFKHVEVLEEVKDFVPENARGAIQNAIEQSSKLFEEEFAQAEEEQRKLFSKYIDKIGGNEVRHLEAFDSINMFADIDKDMFEEMERGREKSRKRIEHRMRGIEDETRKKVFVAHLEDAKMEDARIVNELENNLAPETVATILDIKRQMDQKMRERFEQAETSGDLDSFFNEIEDAPDVQMLEVMNEMEKIIPEDKKEFWGEMKRKAMTEMQEDINHARRFGRMDDQFRQMSGFDPEQMSVIDDFQNEFGGEFGFFEDIKRENAIGIKDRFDNMNEFIGERPEDTEFFERGEYFRSRIQEDPSVRSQIEQFAPGINKGFREFEAGKENIKFSEDNLDEMIKKAEKMVRDLSEKVSSNSDQPGWSAANKLLAQSRNALNAVHPALASGKKGEAFGKATSAIQLASNGLRKLENSAFKEERQEYFEERDEFREKFRELPREERPNPSQFLKFESEVFPSFESSEHKPIPMPVSGQPELKDEPIMCAQVITPALHKTTGKCVVYPNNCIPEGWERVDKCEEKKSFIPDFDEKFDFGRRTIEMEIPEKEMKRLPEEITQPRPAPPAEEEKEAIEIQRLPFEQKTPELQKIIETHIQPVHEVEETKQRQTAPSPESTYMEPIQTKESPTGETIDATKELFR